MSIKILHSTRCVPNGRTYGGLNRTLQIQEDMQEAGFSPVPIDLFDQRFSGRAENLVQGLRLALRNDFPLSRSYANLWTAGRFARIIASAKAATPGILPAFIWENSEDVLLAHAAHAAGLRVVATPHDMVALNRPSGERPLIELEKELTAQRFCSEVLTIGYEETWLLRLLGLPADWYPYVPPRQLRARLEQIRKRRTQGRPPKGILLLGSATNPQTRQGLEHQLLLLRSAPPEIRSQIIIAGNATESLSALTGDGPRLLGAISDGQLDEILGEVSAIWVYQYSGTGALTRVTECIHAGVPVLGGGMSLRSTLHLGGGFAQVDSVQELIGALARLQDSPPPALPCENGENPFLRLLRQMKTAPRIP